ncbi:MAG: glycosyltransferase family 4 protein [Candidatus Moranbacteria bacterium]|nr:glycosyltransferase family 4 protein [Candidatus Moranbacteria bacterium]
MKIAVQAADLDASRVDGTRVYLLELLRRFGKLSPGDRFLVCHRDRFNPELSPPEFPNYDVRVLPGERMWMQTAFAKALFDIRPDRVFIPLQAVPVATPEGTDIIATVHDLAFRHFPKTFPTSSRAKLNLLLGVTVRKATRIIVVSEATKLDLIRYFPDLPASKIRVIHHGVNAAFFAVKSPENERDALLSHYGLTSGSYVLYVGAIQPRKNLVRLIAAFETAKLLHPDMKLVIVGEKAWLSDAIIDRIRRSPFSDDIVRTGRVPFRELPIWYQNARLFAFVSLYEGFGLPALEAFAAGTPTLLGSASSLPEVGGDAALYADPHDESDIAAKLCLLWEDAILRSELRAKGLERVKLFSWDRCAEETLDCIRG